MRLIFKTKILISQSTANLDVNILFGISTHLIDPELGKCLDLLQVSLLINKQTGGKKKKKKEGKGGGERDLWTTCSENEARNSPAQV